MVVVVVVVLLLLLLLCVQGDALDGEAATGTVGGVDPAAVSAMRHTFIMHHHTRALHITHHTSHITHHTSHITHHTSHITHHTSPILQLSSRTEPTERRNCRRVAPNGTRDTRSKCKNNLHCNAERSLHNNKAQQSTICISTTTNLKQCVVRKVK